MSQPRPALTHTNMRTIPGMDGAGYQRRGSGVGVRLLISESTVRRILLGIIARDSAVGAMPDTVTAIQGGGAMASAGTVIGRATAAIARSADLRAASVGRLGLSGDTRVASVASEARRADLAAAFEVASVAGTAVVDSGMAAVAGRRSWRDMNRTKRFSSPRVPADR